MSVINALSKMIAQEPANPLFHYLLGSEYVKQKNYKEALCEFSKALENCDDDLRSRILDELSKVNRPNESLQDTQKQSELKNITDQKEKPPVLLKVYPGGKSDFASEGMNSRASVTFADVGGLDELKETIYMKIIKPFVSPGLFARFRKKSGGGILLFGPPGCGKTFIAKATAGECRAKFTSVNITDVLGPYLGMSEQNIKNIFSAARAKIPSVLFFDELDALGFNRAKSASHHLRPIVDHLLCELDGIETTTEKMLIIAASNMPWDIDPAFRRPGRFDKAVFVPPPDLAARQVIFQLKMAERPIDNMDFAELAWKTELYSGADIEYVVELATEHVLAEIMKTGNERPLTMPDVLKAIKATSPSTIEWLRTIKHYIKYANQSGYYDDVRNYLDKVKTI